MEDIEISSVVDRKIEVKLGRDLIYFNADNFIEDYRRVTACSS